MLRGLGFPIGGIDQNRQAVRLGDGAVEEKTQGRRDAQWQGLGQQPAKMPRPLVQQVRHRFFGQGGFQTGEIDAGVFKVGAEIDVRQGLLTREEVADLLRGVDVFVDLSDYQAFGRSGLEAMACGCAVVLPAAGGTNEYAVEGYNARIVNTTSLEATTTVLQDLVENDDARRRLQRNALSTASNYDVVRASLSEMAVFRVAWTLGVATQKAGTGVYRLGARPVDVDVAAPTREV